MPQTALDFGVVSLRMLMPNSLASYFTRESVEVERDSQALFAGHRSIELNLVVRGRPPESSNLPPDWSAKWAIKAPMFVAKNYPARTRT